MRSWHCHIPLALLVLALVISGCSDSSSGGKKAGTSGSTGGSSTTTGTGTGSSGGGSAGTTSAGTTGSTVLQVGVAAVDITPGFEGFDDANNNSEYDTGETYFDTGPDHLYSPNEPGYDPATNPDPNGDDYD